MLFRAILGVTFRMGKLHSEFYVAKGGLRLRPKRGSPLLYRVCRETSWRLVVDIFAYFGRRFFFLCPFWDFFNAPRICFFAAQSVVGGWLTLCLVKKVGLALIVE